MHRRIVSLVVMAGLCAASAGIVQAQSMPQAQVRGAPQDPPQAPQKTEQKIELSARNFVIEWIVVGALSIGAVFAVGRSSWRG